MTPRFKAWGLLLLLLICLAVTRPAYAREVVIRDIVVTNSSTDLLLFLKVIDALSPEIIDGVKNGLAATFNFEVNLHLVRTGWPDKQIYSGRVEHTLSYDSLKKKYLLTMSENGMKEFSTDNVDKATLMMTSLNGAKLLPLKTLEPDRQYVLKTRATLTKKTLPFYVRYLIPFGNFWNVNTDWHSVDFRF